MGKTLDDLHLPDDPIRPAVQGGSQDVRDTPWYRFGEEIDSLLATGEYTWAEATLQDIRESVERTQRVTDGQRAAVANIEAARTGRSRRYEGYRGRRY